MVHALTTVVLGPLLLLQGRGVRRRLARLPEPPGPRRGEAGDGAELRLLVAGDSSAAGVGAAHQDEALLGRTVARLSDSFRVCWCLEAKTGDRTDGTLARLRARPAERFDVAVTALGVNDATAGRRRATFRRHQRELYQLLREKFGVSLVVVSGLPPVHYFPALPQPLRWYLGRRARQFDRVLRSEAERATGVRYVSLEFTRNPGLMAADGFHPGPPVYTEWGRRVAAAVRERG